MQPGATSRHFPRIRDANLQYEIGLLSQRNKELFLDKMEAATPVIAELAKVTPNTWKSMKGLFTSVENVMRMTPFGNIGQRLQQSAMMPFSSIRNRASFMMEQLFMPMMPIVNKEVIGYETYIMQNQTGALIGGGIGAIVGLWLPGGSVLWGLIGAGIGSLVEDKYKGIEGWGGLVEEYKRGNEAFMNFEDFSSDESGGTGIVQDPTPLPVIGIPGGSRPRLPDGRVIRVI